MALIVLLAPVTSPVGSTNPIPTSAADISGVDTVGLELNADGTLDGSWALLASCNPTGPGATGGADITAGTTTPNLVAVDHANAKTQRQFVQAFGLQAGFVKAVFTPTAGTGKVSANARVG